MFGAHLASDHFGEGKFVVGGFLKTNREGVEFLLGQRSGEGGYGAGVDAAAEEDSDLHITAQLVADCLTKKFAGGLSGFIEGACPDRIVFDGEVVKIFGPTTGG